MSEPNKHLTRAPLSTPLVPANRLVELDILRGLALFGVMAINLVFEFRVSIFEQFPPLNEIASPLDRAVEAFLDQAITLKAFALFSLLFGAGLAIQFERLPVKRRVVLLLRRLVVLLAIGLLAAACGDSGSSSSSGGATPGKGVKCATLPARR